MFPDIYVLFNLFLFVIFVFLFDFLLYEIPMSLKIVQVRRLYPPTDYWLMDCNKFSKKMIFATLCGTEDWQQTWGTFSFTLSFFINFFFVYETDICIYICMYVCMACMFGCVRSHFPTSVAHTQGASLSALLHASNIRRIAKELKQIYFI